MTSSIASDSRISHFGNCGESSPISKTANQGVGNSAPNAADIPERVISFLLCSLSSRRIRFDTNVANPPPKCPSPISGPSEANSPAPTPQHTRTHTHRHTIQKTLITARFTSRNSEGINKYTKNLTSSG